MTMYGTNRIEKKFRLRSSLDFDRVYGEKQRASDSNILIFGAANGLNWSRFGLSVSKKHGNAVCRNRIKRRLREAYRTCRTKLPTGLDFILIPRVGQDASVDGFQASIIGLTRRLATKSRDKA